MIIWQEISLHPGFFASSDGQVRSARGKILSGHHDKDGYRRVKINKKHKAVGRLVLMAFDPIPLSVAHLFEADHLDWNPLNNSIGNLSWKLKEVNGKRRLANDSIYALFKKVLRKVGRERLTASLNKLIA